jgi:hypothetical protein
MYQPQTPKVVHLYLKPLWGFGAKSNTEKIKTEILLHINFLSFKPKLLIIPAFWGILN